MSEFRLCPVCVVLIVFGVILHFGIAVTVGGPYVERVCEGILKHGGVWPTQAHRAILPTAHSRAHGAER